MRPLVAALLLALAPLAAAASPRLDTVLPRGAQRGTEVELVLRGERLQDAEALVFYEPGLEQRGLEVKDGRTVRVRLAVAPGCRPGEHALRLRCRSGLSELRTFHVGTLPQRPEAEPNADAARAQVVPLDCTVEGLLGQDEDVDRFAFDGAAGQRVTLEVEALRLGGPAFDARLELADPAGRTIATSIGRACAGQDALLAAVLPVDGRFVVTLREATGKGSDRHRYRLHLATGPRPTAAFPPGGRPGPLALELLGDPAAVASGAAAPVGTLVTLPAPGPDGLAELLLPGATGPLLLRTSELPCAIETSDVLAAPVALHGRLAAAGEADVWRLQGAKGQRLRARAWCRALGVDADLQLELLRPDGRPAGAADDAGGRLDPDLAVTLQEDGVHLLRVREFLGRGGPEVVYRLEVTPAAPALTLDLQTYGRSSQARNALVVPRGGRMALLVRVERDGLQGAVDVALEGLPPGLTASVAACATDLAAVPVVVSAPADAPLGAWSCRLVGRAGAVQGELRQRVPLVTGPPNDAVYRARVLDRLVVAVVEPAPFEVEVVPQRTPLVATGAGQVEVVVRRAPGFDGPVTLSLLQDPPGVGSREARLEKGQTSGALPVTANARALPGSWPLVVVARADAGGELFACSPVAALEVIGPLVGLKAARAAGPQGATVDVGGELLVERPFEGTATARLVGLPRGCAAPVVSFDATARALRFEVQVGAEAKLGRHKGLAVEVAVPSPRGDLVHRLGPVELRIDPRSEEAPAAARAPGSPLGRLDRLRAERAARRAEEGR